MINQVKIVKANKYKRRILVGPLYVSHQHALREQKDK